jgi:LuxR family transcriptional regulator, maltose regulon positive regulatory protein
VLPELDAERCAAVSGDPGAAHWLDEIERRGLFASVLDSDTYTLRLHDLFRDCLDDRLRREAPGELPGLLQRAAAHEPDPVRRMGYLVRAGDWDAAVHELDALAPELLTLGDVKLLLRLHAQFPAELRLASPRLQLARCLAAWAQWDWDPMREAAEAAAANFARLGDAAGRRRALSYACVAYSSTDDDVRAQAQVDELLAEPALEDDSLSRALLIDCVLALPRDSARLARSWTRLVATLERLDKLQHWYECTPLPGYIGQPGMRAPLWRYVAGVQRKLPAEPIPLSGMVQVTQGWLHLWDMRWPDVDATLAQAEDDCRWVGQPTNLHWQLHMLKGMALALQGDLAGSAAATQVLLDETRALPDTTRRQAFVGRMAYFALRVAVVAGDEARVRRLNDEIARHRHDADWFLTEGFGLCCEAYTAMSEGRSAEACHAWRTSLANESRIDVYGQAVEARLRLAHALAGDGNVAGAVTLLQPVFARLADPQEHGMAITAGPQVLRDLAELRWGTRLVAEQQALLRRWAEVAQALRGAAMPAPSVPALPDLLSAREREVLVRIAAGDSNKLIARAFDLSPHTVKRHVANILDKLGVSTRGQAAAWIRQHG